MRTDRETTSPQSQRAMSNLLSPTIPPLSAAASSQTSSLETPSGLMPDVSPVSLPDLAAPADPPAPEQAAGLNAWVGKPVGRHGAKERTFSTGQRAEQAGLALTDELLERQRLRESNARSYPRKLPLVLARGSGMQVYDTAGRVYLDCLAGAGSLALGHGHPVVTEAIGKVLASGLPLQTLDLASPVKDAFVETLFDLLPVELAQNGRVQFCGPSGADAVEAAVKLAKTVTGKRSLFAFHGAYHGMTSGALALTGAIAAKSAVPNLMGDVHFLPFPSSYRCPFGTPHMSAGLCSAYTETVLRDQHAGVVPPAALIVEPVQGEGGVNPAPPAWLREIRALTAETGAMLIVDEVQTGLGRTGRMWGIDHATDVPQDVPQNDVPQAEPWDGTQAGSPDESPNNSPENARDGLHSNRQSSHKTANRVENQPPNSVVPDIMVLSKAIGGGLPLSVVVYRSDLDVWGPGAHAGTFRGNTTAMAAGTATIDFVKKQGLAARAARLGDRFLALLRQVQQSGSPGSTWIGDVRGLGLMLGVEFVNPQGRLDRSGRPFPDGCMAAVVQREMLRRGVIAETGGRENSVLRFLPPLIVTGEQIDMISAIFVEALDAAVVLREMA